MKKDLSWHQDCLKNRIETYRSERAKAMRLLAVCDHVDKENAFYKEQIDEAMRRGMTGFDREKFLVKRNKD